MHWPLLWLTLATAASAASPAKWTRHSKMAKRAVNVRVAETAAVNCSTLDYQTPVSLATNSLNSTGGCGKTYKVQSGDTCASILENSNSTLSLATFMAINPDIHANCWNLQIGTSYCVETSPCLARSALTLGSCTSYARAGTNDTYRSLAATNNVTLPALKFLNPNATEIRVGRFYCVSNGTSTTEADSTTAKSTPSAHLGEMPVARPADPSPETVPTTTKAVVEEPEPTPEPTRTTQEEVVKTTSVEEKPKVQEQPQEKKAEDKKPADQSPAKAPSGLTMTGDITYYAVGLGSCGWTNGDDELVAAAPAALYDILGDSICGQHVTLNLGGNSVNVRIVDMCPPCAVGAFDLSPTAFQKLAPLSVGRTQMSWDASSLGAAAVAKLAAAGF